MRGLNGLVLFVAAGASIASSLAIVHSPTDPTTSSATSLQVRFTAAGDFAASPGSTGPVLDAIAAVDPDAHFAVGDLSYGVTGQDQAWCDFVTQHVGSGFPFELLAGNHESNGINGNINDFSACLPNQLPGAVGTYGRQYYVDVPQNDPLVRFVMISPDLTFPDGTWRYAAGTPQFNWTADTIDDAHAAGIPWVVTGMHKPCLSLGKYTCSIGADLVNMLMAKQVDLVLLGHEHNYQRTKQLDLRAGCAALTIGTFEPACVSDADDDFIAGEGTVFTTVGTGGAPGRTIYEDDPEAGYFAASAGTGGTPTYGFGDFTATPTQLVGSFQGVGTGYTDTFTVTRGVAPTNSAPVASFNTAAEGRQVTFDGSSSSDSDGVITDYAWAFGEGSRDGGVSPRHQYASDGTYDVTLTVTDDRGATSTVTQPVTVTASPGTDLASDSFERTVSNAWGSADVGGVWTINPTTAGIWAVGGGVGTSSLSSAGGTPAPNAYLKAISSTDLDMQLKVGLSKVPTGNAGRVDQTLILRRRASDSYRAVVQLAAGGLVKVRLARFVAGTGTNLAAVTTVPGLTYTGADQLHIRTQATGTAPTTLRVKVWKVGTAEPSSWTQTAQDSTSSLQGSGYAGLSSFLSPGVSNAPIEVRYDDLRLATASTLP